MDDRCAALVCSGGEFRPHDLVVMPDHAHLLMTAGGGTTVEKAMQFIKGGFSYRLKKECGYWGEVWRHGFAETRVEDRPSFFKHRGYIAGNPVKAGVVDSPEKFPYDSAHLAKRKVTGARAL